MPKDIFGPTQMKWMLEEAQSLAKNKQNPKPTIVPAASSSSSWDNPFTARPPESLSEEPAVGGKKRSMAGWAKHKERDQRRADARKQAAAESKGKGKSKGKRKGKSKGKAGKAKDERTNDDEDA